MGTPGSSNTCSLSAAHVLPGLPARRATGGPRSAQLPRSTRLPAGPILARSRSGVTALPQQVDAVGDDSVRDVWRALPRVAQTEAAPAQPAESAVVQFTGYSEKQMHTIKEMSGQLRWNEALNILEAIVAAGVIAGGGFETGLGSTERLLYITCCLSNAFCLRVAREHFQEIRANDSDGLLLTLAGIQDLNILFSSVSFVVMLRGLVQCMEAGIADPSLVGWVQGLGIAAVAARLAVVQSVLKRKGAGRSPATPRPTAGRSNIDALAEVTLSLALQLSRFSLLSAPAQSSRLDWLRRPWGAPDPVALLPIDWVLAEAAASSAAACSAQAAAGPTAPCSSSSADSADSEAALGATSLVPATLDADAASAASNLAAIQQWPEITLPNGMRLYNDSLDITETMDLEDPLLRQLDCCTGTVDLDTEGLESRHGRYTSRSFNDLSRTSVSIDELSGQSQTFEPHRSTLSGLLSVVGLSVDNPTKPTLPTELWQEAPDLEYELVGWEERLLVINSDQLQWGALCMTLLALSSSLLSVAHGLPQHIVHLSLESAPKDLPDLVGASVDLSEQIIMAAALTRARNSFGTVVRTQGRDITYLLEGLCHKKGLGLFLETWGVVQCGVIAGMATHFGLLQGGEWAEVPARELLRAAGSLLR